MKDRDSSEIGKIIFNGSLWDPRFYPAYSPNEMLDMGVFGGTYLNSVRDELPAEWFSGGRVLPPGNRPDISLNYFKVSSGMSLSEWQKKGWIMTDRLGWFQWYCNYFLGRRLG